MRLQIILLPILIALSLSVPAFAQSSSGNRTLSGVVRIEPSGTPAKNAVVAIAELEKSMLTDENGAFEFNNIPAGKYQVFAHLDRVPDLVQTVEVTGSNQTIDFRLTLAPVSEQVTVTATGSAEAVNTSYKSVTSV